MREPTRARRTYHRSFINDGWSGPWPDAHYEELGLMWTPVLAADGTVRAEYAERDKMHYKRVPVA